MQAALQFIGLSIQPTSCIFKIIHRDTLTWAEYRLCVWDEVMRGILAGMKNESQFIFSGPTKDKVVTEKAALSSEFNLNASII